MRASSDKFNHLFVICCYLKSVNELKPKYFENKFLIYHNDIYDEYFSKYDVNEGVVKIFNY